MPWLDNVVRAKRSERLPVVLTREEVRAVIREVQGPPRLMAILLYGAGLRLLDCARLRVKDVDFAANQIIVRAGKGDRDRVSMLPAAVKNDLARHLEMVRRQHEADLRHGAGWVELPWALARKYPHAGREWLWQWVFSATRIYVDRETGQRRRHHLHESVLQRAVKEAVRRAGIAKRATCHTFRHSFAMSTVAHREPLGVAHMEPVWQRARIPDTKMVVVLLGGVGAASAARGELFLGVLGAETLTGDLDEVRAVGQAIEGRRREQRLAEELRPLRAIAITGQQDRAALIPFVDDVVQILGAGGA